MGRVPREKCLTALIVVPARTRHLVTARFSSEKVQKLRAIENEHRSPFGISIKRNKAYITMRPSSFRRTGYSEILQMR